MSDTEARDQLTGELLGVLAVASNFPEHAQVRLLGQDMRPLAEKCADAILNAGWRPPARTVTTVEELDALPVGSIVRDVERASLDEKLDDDMLAELAYERTFFSRSIRLPATVLYEPKDDE